jgi:hypothetical protein
MRLCNPVCIWRFADIPRARAHVRSGGKADMLDAGLVGGRRRAAALEIEKLASLNITQLARVTHLLGVPLTWAPTRV